MRGTEATGRHRGLSSSVPQSGGTDDPGRRCRARAEARRRCSSLQRPRAKHRETGSDSHRGQARHRGAGAVAWNMTISKAPDEAPVGQLCVWRTLFPEGKRFSRTSNTLQPLRVCSRALPPACLIARATTSPVCATKGHTCGTPVCARQCSVCTSPGLRRTGGTRGPAWGRWAVDPHTKGAAPRALAVPSVGKQSLVAWGLIFYD